MLISMCKIICLALGDYRVQAGNKGLQLPVKYCLHEKLIKIKYLVFFHSGFVMIFVIFHMPTQGKFYIFQL